MTSAPAISTKRTDVVRLACNAMATRFELVMHGRDPITLRAAGEEALAEVVRIESQLTRFRATSTIGRLNELAAASPVRVEAPVFDLLSACRDLWEVTGGAFDVTVGPLMRLWGFRRGQAHIPGETEIAQARDVSGMHLIDLDPSERTVRYQKEGVSIDLGAVGKGYAVDEAMRILQDYGIEHALLHGGSSTIAAIGSSPDSDAWRAALPDRIQPEGTTPTIVALLNSTISVSAIWGRELSLDDDTYGHVIDPRSGKPVEGAVFAAVQSDSAMVSDALSTALLAGADADRIMSHYHDMRGLVVTRAYSPASTYPFPSTPGIITV